MENNNEIISEDNKTEEENIKEQNVGSENNKKGRLLDDILEIAETTITTAFIVILIFTYLLHPVQIVGKSMQDTLQPEDKIFMSTVYFDLSYGDIIIIDNDWAYLKDEASGNIIKASSGSFNECIIKRVIAKGGDTIDFDFENGKVIVNGKVLDEKFLNGVKTNTDYGSFNYPLTVPDGYYFVMGDNRNASCDSRHPNVGLIKRSQIYGKAVLKYASKSENSSVEKADFKILWN